MGYNTTVVVMNDALSDIRKDPEFGRKLADAVMGLFTRDGNQDGIDVDAGCSVNAATVIETHHSSEATAVLVGANCGTRIDNIFIPALSPDKEFDLLDSLARKLGYKLVKKNNAG